MFVYKCICTHRHRYIRVYEGGCRVSHLGDIKKLLGHGSGQLALGVPA